MTAASEYDVIVVGAGPAGEVAAGRLADRGRRVALVERELVGGECSYWACMPSKALLRPAQAVAEARRIPGAAQAVTGELDVTAVLQRRDEVIHELDDSSMMPWLAEHGIELHRGAARLDGERRVRVGDDVLVAADAVVVAVGSGAAVPPIPGLADVGAWSNREMTTAERPPGRLLVLGGGVVGSEMAQAWSTLGSQVVLVEALDRLIAGEEPVASDELRRALDASGVDVRTGLQAESASRTGREITLTLEDGSEVTGDRLLVAIGRTPHTPGLGLETIGLPGEGYLKVDDHLRVAGHPWLYAIGDVNGRSLLTHAGKYQARIAADNIVGDEAVAVSDRTGAPRVVFTDPQIAAVGLTLSTAREAGIDACAIDVSTSGNAGGSFYGRGVEGTTRFVVDRDRELLVGVTFVGAETLDFLHAATIAVVAEVPLRRLAHAIPAFPTRAEVWLKLVEKYEAERGITLHGPSASAYAPASASASAPASA